MKEGITVLGALVVLMVLASASAGSAHETFPVQNITITPIQGFPTSIVAGSTYTVRYLLNNTGNEAVTMFVNMNVSNRNYPVNLGEFFVSMWINSSRLNCSERMPGSFHCYNKTSEYGLARKSGNELYINFSSVPNLYPDKNYTFTLGILTQNPLINLLFADGSGQLNLAGKRITGQAKIYMDSSSSSAIFWIMDSRSRNEYSRSYEVRSHFRTWYGEVYDCANELGQTFGINVYFNVLVYASCTDVFFYGWKV